MRYLVTAILIFLFLGVVGFGGFLYLEKSCSSEPSLQQDRGISNDKGANDKTENSDASKSLSDKKIEHTNPSFFDLRVTESYKIEGHYYAAGKPREESNWRNNFVCEMKLDGLLVALFTLFLVLVTGLLGISTDLLRKAGDMAQQTSIAGQRAYISLLAPHADFVRDNSGHIFGLRVWCTWKNSGTTPATDVLTIIGATFAPNPDDFVFGYSENTPLETPLAIGPGVEIQSGEIVISPQHFLAALNRSGAQFFWGRARYRDIFPNSPEHIVEFCYRVLLDGTLGPVTSDISVGFTPIR
jgi:hypothetical protein